MAKIESIEIHPCTQGSTAYVIGYTARGPNTKVTEIEVIHNEGVTLIQVFVGSQLYVEYVNVPYAIYYKLDEVTEQQK